MRKRRYFITVIWIVILCMSGSVYFTYHNVRGILRDNYQEGIRMKSGTIASTIDNCFLRPITVAETMSKDVSMRHILNVESKEEAENAEDEASAYLKSIRDGFGYAMVFAVSDASKAYFTYDGITKYLDPEHVEADSWYQKFIDKDADRTYDVEVDTDVVNNWALSVFINAEVCDEKGGLLGLCGVGVDMTELQNLLERFERIYDVKITLIDHTGLIQVDTNAANIKNAYIMIDNLDNLDDGECYYEFQETGSRTITYMEDLDWYLVVQNNSPFLEDLFSVLLPGVAGMIICVLLLGSLFFFYSKKRLIKKKH